MARCGESDRNFLRVDPTDGPWHWQDLKILKWSNPNPLLPVWIYAMPNRAVTAHAGSCT
jgi:hypothetical protein